MEDKTVIVLASFSRTGSTFLYNAICGLVNPELTGISFLDEWCDVDKIKTLKHLDIVKTHYLRIANIQLTMRACGYNPYFITIVRNNITFKCDKDILTFKYEDVLETEEYTLQKIVDYIHDKLEYFLPKEIKLNKKACLNRLIKMNEKVEELENEKFEVHDMFFLIHGRHRKRKKQ